MSYSADPNRSVHADGTGIYLRAKRGDKWDSVDIAELDADSLRRWLMRDQTTAVNVVGILLGHGNLTPGDAAGSGA